MFALFGEPGTIPRMLSLRLQRVGRKHDPSYRIVATDSRSGPKTNKHVAVLGHYDAIRKTTVIKDVDEVKKYIGFGAKITDTLYNIFVQQGIIEGKKKNVLPKKSPVVDEEALAREAEEQAAAEAAAQAEAANAPAEDNDTTDEPTEEETPAEETTPEELITEEPATETEEENKEEE